MAININLAQQQAVQLNEYAEHLRNIRQKLIDNRELLNIHWQAFEMQYVNSAIESIERDLLRISGLLEKIQLNIKTAAYQIRQEELQKAAKEKATGSGSK